MRQKSLLAALAALTLAAHSHAMQLPEFTGPWANGGPYTKEGVLGSGKPILLYFYEET